MTVIAFWEFCFILSIVLLIFLLNYLSYLFLVFLAISSYCQCHSFLLRLWYYYVFSFTKWIHSKIHFAASSFHLLVTKNDSYSMYMSFISCTTFKDDIHEIAMKNTPLVRLYLRPPVWYQKDKCKQRSQQLKNDVHSPTIWYQ